MRPAYVTALFHVLVIALPAYAVLRPRNNLLITATVAGFFIGVVPAGLLAIVVAPLYWLTVAVMFGLAGVAGGFTFGAILALTQPERRSSRAFVRAALALNLALVVGIFSAPYLLRD